MAPAPLIDWLNILKRVQDVRDRDKRMLEAKTNTGGG
jgi:hypothetical protein